MKKLTIPVDALESERINKGIRRLVREGFLKDNPDSQICRVRNAAAGNCSSRVALVDAEEARRTWQERGDFRKYAQRQGWLIEWQRQRFSTDYCVVRYLVRKAYGEFA